jgi:ATP-binding cassette subfamily G (WHITE) protein 2 (PDR)
VEKHAKYAFYHPFAEAIGMNCVVVHPLSGILNNIFTASMICDMPNKVGTATVFNLALYFMTNLRRTPGHFFIFYLFTFMCTLTISMYFRSIGALSRTLSQAMAPAAVFILALVIYTGFAIPTRYMHPWFRWLNWINPVAYGFESLMINEFHDRKIPCSASMFVPAGPSYFNITPDERICSTTVSRMFAPFF